MLQWRKRAASYGCLFVVAKDVQSRDEFDAAKVAAYKYEVLRGMEHNFKNQDRSVSYDTRYDYSSIMCYGPTEFSKNGQPTMLACLLKFGRNLPSGFKVTDIFK
ncbi:hypothetical protein ACROYT_G014611 [Oculina patagonica]